MKGIKSSKLWWVILRGNGQTGTHLAVLSLLDFVKPSTAIVFHINICKNYKLRQNTVENMNVVRAGVMGHSC
jgi:hypothetical protein